MITHFTPVSGVPIGNVKSEKGLRQLARYFLLCRCHGGSLLEFALTIKPSFNVTIGSGQFKVLIYYRFLFQAANVVAGCPPFTLVMGALPKGLKVFSPLFTSGQCVFTFMSHDLR